MGFKSRDTNLIESRAGRLIQILQNFDICFIWGTLSSANLPNVLLREARQTGLSKVQLERKK